jgi:hypothetical protein
MRCQSVEHANRGSIRCEITVNVVDRPARSIVTTWSSVHTDDTRAAEHQSSAATPRCSLSKDTEEARKRGEASARTSATSPPPTPTPPTSSSPPSTVTTTSNQPQPPQHTAIAPVTAVTASKLHYENCHGHSSTSTAAGAATHTHSHTHAHTHTHTHTHTPPTHTHMRSHT